MTNAQLDQFITDARCLLDESSASLKALERDPDDASLIATVFDAVRALKDASGPLELTPLTGLMNVGEDLLDMARSATLELTPDALDVMTASFEQVGGWLTELEATGALPGDAADVAAPRIADLRAMVERAAAGSDAGAPPDAPAAGSGPDWLGIFSEDDRLAALVHALETGAAIQALRYAPGAGALLAGQDPLSLVGKVPERLATSVTAAAPWPAIAELDPQLCNLVFQVLTTAGVDTLTTLFESVSAEVEVVAVEPPALIRPSGDLADSGACERFAADALERLADAPETALEDLRAATQALLLRTPAAAREAAMLRGLAVALAVPPTAPAWLEGLVRAIGNGSPRHWAGTAGAPSDAAKLYAEEAPSQEEAQAGNSSPGDDPAVDDDPNAATGPEVSADEESLAGEDAEVIETADESADEAIIADDAATSDPDDRPSDDDAAPSEAAADTAADGAAAVAEGAEDLVAEAAAASDEAVPDDLGDEPEGGAVETVDAAADEPAPADTVAHEETAEPDVDRPREDDAQEDPASEIEPVEPPVEDDTVAQDDTGSDVAGPTADEGDDGTADADGAEESAAAEDAPIAPVVEEVGEGTEADEADFGGDASADAAAAGEDAASEPVLTESDVEADAAVTDPDLGGAPDDPSPEMLETATVDTAEVPADEEGTEAASGDIEEPETAPDHAADAEPEAHSPLADAATGLDEVLGTDPQGADTATQADTDAGEEPAEAEDAAAAAGLNDEDADPEPVPVESPDENALPGAASAADPSDGAEEDGAAAPATVAADIDATPEQLDDPGGDPSVVDADAEPQSPPDPVPALDDGSAGADTSDSGDAEEAEGEDGRPDPDEAATLTEPDADAGSAEGADTGADAAPDCVDVVPEAEAAFEADADEVPDGGDAEAPAPDHEALSREDAALTAGEPVDGAAVPSDALPDDGIATADAPRSNDDESDGAESNVPLAGTGQSDLAEQEGAPASPEPARTPGIDVADDASPDLGEPPAEAVIAEAPPPTDDEEPSAGSTPDAGAQFADEADAAPQTSVEDGEPSTEPEPPLPDGSAADAPSAEDGGVAAPPPAGNDETSPAPEMQAMDEAAPDADAPVEDVSEAAPASDDDGEASRDLDVPEAEDPAELPEVTDGEGGEAATDVGAPRDDAEEQADLFGRPGGEQGPDDDPPPFDGALDGAGTSAHPDAEVSQDVELPLPSVTGEEADGCDDEADSPSRDTDLQAPDNAEERCGRADEGDLPAPDAEPDPDAGQEPDAVQDPGAGLNSDVEQDPGPEQGVADDPEADREPVSAQDADLGEEPAPAQEPDAVREADAAPGSETVEEADDEASAPERDTAEGPAAEAAETGDADAGAEVPPEVIAAGRGLRVDPGQVERMMQLAGELVVARNALPHLARRVGDVPGARDVGRAIKAHHAILDRIARDMEGIVLAVRMRPFADLVQHVSGPAREYARGAGKAVEIVAEGAATEVDRLHFDPLATTLARLVRYAVDHGIEPAEVRTAAGKAATGSVRLSARHEGDRCVIEVRDDGGGLDLARVREKAVSCGILGVDDRDTLPAADVARLVLARGFSAREAAADPYGRGVAMDWARSAVEAIGGSVSLATVEGEGTAVRLSLPLARVVTPLMAVECGGQLYGVPMEAVCETDLVTRDNRHRVADREVFAYRQAVHPIVRLADLLRHAPAPPAEAEESVLVASLDGERVGIVVDAVVGAMDVVVKPVEGMLAGFAGYRGTALTSDGRVIVVLDLKELAECRSAS
ncbi:chemotaxis protein CheW [Acuticoccus sediminis]|nr:chemotaxis protein CheW [Acuticoccus sediminis]